MFGNSSRDEDNMAAEEPRKPAVKIEDKMKLQCDEFAAVKELAEQYKQVSSVAVIDDDYPSVRHDYEVALAEVLRVARLNGK